MGTTCTGSRPLKSACLQLVQIHLAPNPDARATNVSPTYPRNLGEGPTDGTTAQVHTGRLASVTPGVSSRDQRACKSSMHVLPLGRAAAA